MLTQQKAAREHAMPQRNQHVIPDDFLAAVQARVARVAASASATRGQGRGSARNARVFLETLPLQRFSTADRASFQAVHNEATDELRRALPTYARSWGLSRKLLNIFLRDALYTTYLQAAHKLEASEVFFEVPLDSITAKALKEFAGRGKLPPWPGVKHLTPAVSALFQEAASRCAKQRVIAPVHLDTYWWGERKVAA